MVTTMSTTTKTLEDKLVAVIRRARELRAAGVHHIEVDGVVIDMLPDIPEGPPERNEKLRGELDVLDDPDTFGGAVPSLRGNQQ